MIYPEEFSICLNCDANLVIIDDDYKICESCRIYYGLLIYDDYCSFIIWSDGHVSSIHLEDQAKNKTLFHIDECETFKEVLNRINKLLIFS